MSVAGLRRSRVIDLVLLLLDCFEGAEPGARTADDTIRPRDGRRPVDRACAFVQPRHSTQ